MPVAPRLFQERTPREINATSFFRRFLSVTNLPLLFVAAALVVYGLVVVYSVVEGDPDYSFTRQASGVLIGFILMCALWWFDYRKLASMAFPLLIVSVILILLPLIPGIGLELFGSKSWILIFNQQLQPGEFAKPLIILYAAALIARYEGRLNSGLEYLKVLALLMIPVICVLLQPDIGTALVFFVIGMVVLFAGGANRKWLLITAISIVVLIVGVVVLDGVLDNALGRDVLIKDYQKNRILVFLNADIDPTGIGWQLNQAKIAIGSGGLMGKGFGNAPQALLGFLPETPTDFIFCVLAEQFGFVGSLALIGLYVILFFVILRIAFAANNHFGALITVGILGMWVFHVFENIGMTCGLMPITGIPLPFMSYGSSFMVTNFIVLGLLCSVWAHRNTKKRSKG